MSFFVDAITVTGFEVILLHMILYKLIFLPVGLFAERGESLLQRWKMDKCLTSQVGRGG